jgi:hypothetical protein
MCNEMNGYNLKEKSHNSQLARFPQDMNFLIRLLSVTTWIRVLSSFITKFHERNKKIVIHFSLCQLLHTVSSGVFLLHVSAVTNSHLVIMTM